MMTTEYEVINTDEHSSEDEKIKKLRKGKRQLVAENKRLSHELEKSQGFANFLQYIVGLSDDNRDRMIIALKDKIQSAINLIVENNAGQEEILDVLRSEVDLSAMSYAYEKGVEDGKEYSHNTDKKVNAIQSK